MEQAQELRAKGLELAIAYMAATTRNGSREEIRLADLDDLAQNFAGFIGTGHLRLEDD